MNSLFTEFLTLDDNRVATVAYTNSMAKPGGTVNVQLPKEIESSEVVAELCAMHFLLKEKDVLGNKVYSGKGVQLNVSQGAIRKLFLNKSDKKDAAPYASFLKYLMDGCSIKVNKKGLPVDIENTPNWTIDSENFKGFSLEVETPKIGKVFLTGHAIDRYENRVIEESGECAYPLQSLVKRISNPDISPIEIPKKVLEHKDKKYGDNQKTEFWKHSTSTLVFTVVENLESKKKFLVTAFVRKM